MARSELYTRMFQDRERAGDKRDEFDSPSFRAEVRRTRAEGRVGSGVADAMEAERRGDVRRARKKGLSDLTALSDSDYLNFQRRPGSYADQTDDVRRYELRAKLPRTAGIGSKAKGGAVKKAKGGSVSASKRADGVAKRGRTRGKIR